MKIKEIAQFLWQKYPNQNQEEWDKSGFSIKHNFNKKLSGVVVSLDLTIDVLNYAIETNSNLIITHHPFLFEGDITFETEKYPHKNKMYELIYKHKIFVLSLHTNYDIDKHGTSYQIVKALDLENAKFKNVGYPCLLTYKTTPLELLKIIKQELNIQNFRTNLDNNYLNKSIEKIAFFSGSGDSSDILAKGLEGIELIFTSDIKWSDWLTYNQNNIPIIEISHLDEQVFVHDIFNQLKDNFSDQNINFILLNEQYKNL